MPLKPPDVGHAYFYDNINPPLNTGVYEMRVDHKVANVDGVPSSIDDADVETFEIVGPRFRLNPTDIHSLYPPPNGNGPFVGRLPQVVLTRRTLPWERAIEQAPSDDSLKDIPWLAVLLLEEDEVELLDSVTVQSIVQHNITHISAYEPLSLSAAESNMKCMGVSIELDLFEEIAPMLSEIKYLSHGRQVNTDDKELLGMDQDGWFAVVIGNRLPQPGRKYVACLVSLEGMQNVLPDDHEPVDEFFVPSIPPVVGGGDVVIDNPFGELELIEGVNFPTEGNFVSGAGASATENARENIALSEEIAASGTGRFMLELYLPTEIAALADGQLAIPPRRIQLVTLARWQFETNETPGTFESLMAGLDSRGGVAMLGENQSSATLPDVEPQNAPDYQVALDSGHVPLKHITREGETTLAWYRGPLTPVGVHHDKSAGPYHTSDQARRIDPLTGFENLGYASAFELGRLMALSDSRFAVELLRWRRDSHRQIAGKIQLLAPSLLEETIQGFLDKLIQPDALMYADLMGEIVNQIYIDFGINSLIQPADITGFGGFDSPLFNFNLGNTLPGTDGVTLGEMLNQGTQLEGITVRDMPALTLETNLGILAENADAEFEHLETFLSQTLDNFGGNL